MIRPLTFSQPGQFELYCHRSPATVYPEEVHDTIQVCIPLERALYSVVRQSDTGRQLVHHLGARDVLAIPTGQPHAVHWRRRADIVSLQLSATFVGRALGIARMQLPDTFTVRDPLISAAAVELRRAVSDAGSPSLAYAEALATTIAYRVGVHASTNPGIRAKERVAAFPRLDLARMERFIDEHLDQPISVTALADLTGLSLWHFMRRFNASYGVSPHEFITHRRLSRARNLLSDSKLSVAEIALEIGMTHSHMSRTFLRQFGLSPREFRRQQHR